MPAPTTTQRATPPRSRPAAPTAVSRARGRPTAPDDARAPRLELDIAALRRALLVWYRAERRDLPWRRGRDPYRIWIAEIMLQQTRVDSVLPHYERFLGLFPDVQRLARARLDAVLRAWSGLGYYARARNLHAAARHIVRAHGGRFPATANEVRALPGIGPYTAGAILSIAFGRPAPVLDGNVVRVLARLLALEDVESPGARRGLWDLATRWAACRAPGDANQALMELGATVCVKPTPDCGRCPLELACAARRLDRERLLPRPRRRPAPGIVPLVAALLCHRGRLLLVRRRSGRLLRGWWELPTDLASDGAPARRGREDAGDGLARRLHERLGVRVSGLEPAGHVTHGILHQRLLVQLFAAREPDAIPDARRRHAARRRVTAGASRPAAPPPGSRATPLANLDLEDLEVRWASPRQSRALPLSTLTRKALGVAAAADSSWAEYLDGHPAEEPRHQRHDGPSR